MTFCASWAIATSLNIGVTGHRRTGFRPPSAIPQACGFMGASMMMLRHAQTRDDPWMRKIEYGPSGVV
jgi:hypothetical protein